MNLARAIGRLASILAALATAMLTVAAATAAALATPRPRPPGWNKHPPRPANTQPAIKPPPGWTKHPALPGHIHTVVTGGLPGWQLTLIAIAGVLLVTAVNAPRPGLGTRWKANIRPRRPDMDVQSLRDLLADVLAGEPPLGPVAQNALASGIRLRRRWIRPPLP
jgi:hypothetical protein